MCKCGKEIADIVVVKGIDYTFEVRNCDTNGEVCCKATTPSFMPENEVGALVAAEVAAEAAGLR